MAKISDLLAAGGASLSAQALLQSGKAAAPSKDFLDALKSALIKRAPEDLAPIFKEAAEKFGVPQPLLEAVAKAESNFNPVAVSPAGAMGVMQLMPGTAKSLGVTDAFDPYQNIMGGARYLSDMLRRYGGDVRLALAAYNAGPGNVDKYGGVPPFQETQSYVEKVMGMLEAAGAEGIYKGAITPVLPVDGEISNEALAELMKTMLLSGMLDATLNSASLFGDGESGEQHLIGALLRMQLGLFDASDISGTPL
jgi:hypothetical protein